MRFVAVLVDPARPANVGAAARALKNFGGELRLVGGEHALPGGTGHAEASALAWNARDVLDGAQVYVSIAEAVADASFSGAASGRVEPASGRVEPGVGVGVLAPREFAQEAARLPEHAVVACVFGSEESGLSREQLDHCRARVRIPTRSEQPSLNLAQAVVVVAYEMSLAHASRRASPGAAPIAAAATDTAMDAVRRSRELTPDDAADEAPLALSDDAPALESDIERLALAFRALGLHAGFLNPQAPEHVAGELRRLLARARPTAREIRLLLGLAAQLRWAGENWTRGS